MKTFIALFEIDNNIGIVVYSLTDFMDECNDQEINLENYFLTYVNAELV